MDDSQHTATGIGTRCTHAADVEEQALQVCKLRGRDAQQAGRLVHHATGQLLIRGERICGQDVRPVVRGDSTLGPYRTR